MVINMRHSIFWSKMCSSASWIKESSHGNCNARMCSCYRFENIAVMSKRCKKWKANATWLEDSWKVIHHRLQSNPLRFLKIEEVNGTGVKITGLNLSKTINYCCLKQLSKGYWGASKVVSRERIWRFIKGSVPITKPVMHRNNKS